MKKYIVICIKRALSRITIYQTKVSLNVENDIYDNNKLIEEI